MSGVSAKDICVRFDGYDFGFTVAAFKEVVFDDGATFTGIGIEGIVFGDELNSFITVACFTIGNIDKMIVVNVVFFTLIANVNLQQLTAAGFCAIVGFVLEAAVIDFDLLAFGKNAYPFADLNIIHHAPGHTASCASNLYVAFFCKVETYEMYVISPD